MNLLRPSMILSIIEGLYYYRKSMMGVNIHELFCRRIAGEWEEHTR